MSNNWGGARPGAGRKSYAHIKHCHELLQQAVTDQDFIDGIRELFAIWKNNDPTRPYAKPRESIEAAKVVLRYAFGIPEPEEPPKEKEIKPITTIQIMPSCMRDCDKHKRFQGMDLPDEDEDEDLPPAPDPTDSSESERPSLWKRDVDPFHPRPWQRVVPHPSPDAPTADVPEPAAPAAPPGPRGPVSAPSAPPASTARRASPAVASVPPSSAECPRVPAEPAGMAPNVVVPPSPPKPDPGAKLGPRARRRARRRYTLAQLRSRREAERLHQGQVGT